MHGRLIVHVLPGRSAHNVAPMIRSFHENASEMGLGDAEQLFVLHDVEPGNEDRFRDLGPAPDRVLLRPGLSLDPGILDGTGPNTRFVFHSGFYAGMWDELRRRPDVCGRSAIVFWGADLMPILRPAHLTPGRLLRHPLRASRWMLRHRQRRTALHAERQVLRRLAAVCTLTPGEMEIVERQLGPCGNYLPIVYHTLPRHLPLLAAGDRRRDGDLRVVVGNSGHGQSRHLEALPWLAPFRNERLRVICPLAYPREPSYDERVIRMGEQLFGTRFEAITALRPLNEYDRFLDSVDVFILNARTQQGMYPITYGLLRGKKVYLPTVSPVYRMLTFLGARVFDVRELQTIAFPELGALSEEDRARNHEIAERHFSLEAAFGRWKALFARLEA